ncbi:hypothetical protein NEOLEDRAFT_1184909 [Neolentinus lepideus HHB14362 ss-1]|uniref:Uncharacterized protein n=1 Tax=Neolentinus lepideus HHB14362 ss-1 TaxID=1314782 RepID=A0A165JRN8_9AGAM|nr:hypothetical protein NEOLEDRAFT_1184909 [Neolentinus lepideus HHB14362 ss-1]
MRLVRSRPLEGVASTPVRDVCLLVLSLAPFTRLPRCAQPRALVSTPGEDPLALTPLEVETVSVDASRGGD